MSKPIYTILKKEISSYFEGMQAWIILTSYILLSMFITFFIGGFFTINNSGLFSFFYFQSYIYAFLVPAITMKLWAEERKTGTLEFLLTQPISLVKIVIGKFLAAWSLCFCMLVLSFPLWIFMNIYFSTDNLNILSGYFAVILMSGAFSAIGCLISSFCTSPAVSYLGGLIVFLILNTAKISSLTSIFDLSKSLEIKLHSSLSFEKHFYDLITGQISLDNITYFVLIIIICLWLNIMSIEYKKN